MNLLSLERNMSWRVLTDGNMCEEPGRNIKGRGCTIQSSIYAIKISVEKSKLILLTFYHHKDHVSTEMILER